MKPIRFFDANVAVGPRKVISWGQPVAAADVFSRLRECGIEEALVFHTTAVENHPAVGNARIAEEIRGIPGAAGLHQRLSGPCGRCFHSQRMSSGTRQASDAR